MRKKTFPISGKRKVESTCAIDENFREFLFSVFELGIVKNGPAQARLDPKLNLSRLDSKSLVVRFDSEKMSIKAREVVGVRESDTSRHQNSTPAAHIAEHVIYSDVAGQGPWKPVLKRDALVI